MIFYGTYSMILSISIYSNFVGTVASFDTIIDNVKLEPITDIKISENQGNIIN